MESDGSVRTPGSAAYFLVGSSRVSCGTAVSGQLTIPVGRPMSNQDVSGPSLIVQMTPSRSQTQDHHARTTVVRTANQPVTMHRFPLQLNHTSTNHVLSPNQHFKQIPVYQQRNTSSMQMESVRKNVFVSTPVASPQIPYNRVGLTPHMLMTYMPPRTRLPNNQRTRVVPVNRPNPVLRRDHCPSDDDILEITDLRPVYDPKKPAELIKVEHNYCLVPRISPQRNNQVNGSTPKLNTTAGQSCIVSPTVSQQTPNPQNNVNNNTRVIQKPIQSNPVNVPITTTEPPLRPSVKCESPIQVESELSASDHDVDGQGEETDTAPEAVAECKDNIKSEEPAVTRCICEMEHDDGFMISCDKCLVWQHVDCVLESRNNLPEEYLCERCSPRPFNKEAAAALQHMKLAKRISMASASHLTHSSDSDISTELDVPIDRNNIQNKRKKYKSRQKSAPKRKSNGLPPQIKQRRKNGPPQSGPRKKSSMTPEKKALAEERKKMLIKRKEMLLEKKRLAAIDKKKKVNQEKKIIQKKKTIDSSDDEPKIFKADKSNKHGKSNIEQPVDQLRNWIDKYEEAVTNHYSQELRARLSSIKPNGTMITGEIRTPVKIPISRTKMSLLPSGIKMLVSSSVLANNQPIIEVRGKFTWTGSLAYKDPIPNRTDPYVFFYVVRLSTDCDIEVCVDCRTYGNDARFVRRSCKPNAELKHYIEKGSIHLYIVANQYIEKNSEITINHQAAVPFKRCNCGDPSRCTAMNPALPVTAPPVSVVLESSSSSPLIDPTVSHSSDDDDNKLQRTKRTRQQRNLKKSNNKKILKRASKCETLPPSSVKNKEPNGPGRPKSPVKKVETSPEPLDHKSNNNDKIVKRLSEMSREERKMVAIMKAFERMEKKEARKQESRIHKETDTFTNSSPLNLNRNRVRKSVVKRKQRPSNKSSRSKSSRTNRPQRRAAAISSRSYNSSSDEDDNNNDDEDDDDDRKGRLLSRKRVQNRCKFSVRFQHRPSAQSSVSRSMLRRSPHNNLLNTPVNKIDSEDASGSEGTPPTPLSNACMLVAAAVGPLAPGFKFPNTKKDFVNSWVKSEGNSPTGSEDYKLGEVGCAKKRWLQQAISEQDSVGISNGDQQVGPLKKRRMARESMSECPSPTVSGSGHLSFVEDDIIEDEEVEQASRNIASIDSKLAIFENKNMSLMDMQKSSNTVALVESFLGQFKPDEDESSPESLDDKSNIKMITESQVDDSLIPKKETLSNISKMSKQLDNEVSNKMKASQLNTGVNIPINTYDDALKETIKKCVVREKQSQPSPPPLPPPPVKRKLSLSEYRRRKESQATVTKERETDSGASDVTRPSPSVSPNTTLAAYEEITQQVIAKSLELESKLALKSGPSIFESSVSKEEPKWENLNDRLRRQFGVNVTEDIPKRHSRLSPDFIPTPIEPTRYPYYHRSDEQLYSCSKEDILLPSTTVHENGPPKLFTPPSQAYFSTMFFRQPPPPPPPPPPV